MSISYLHEEGPVSGEHYHTTSFMAWNSDERWKRNFWLQVAEEGYTDGIIQSELESETPFA